MRHYGLSGSNEINDDSSNKDADADICAESLDSDIDCRRRRITQAPAVMALMLFGLQQRAAVADDENLLEIDQNKVVMQVSSKNVPKKYDSGNAQLQEEVVMNSNLFNLSDPEQRRIDVFEKAAPSVVYIDTFAEQRDVFSTNIMEVPIGTGSGFVSTEDQNLVQFFVLYYGKLCCSQMI